MRLIEIYFDEDAIEKALIAELRSRCVSLITASEASMLNRPDSEHLAFAAERNAVLFSFNMGDYCRLHEEWLQQGREQLLQIRSERSAEEMKNRIEFLSTWG